jgi:hypothetical protein
MSPSRTGGDEPICSVVCVDLGGYTVIVVQQPTASSQQPAGAPGGFKYRRRPRISLHLHFHPLLSLEHTSSPAFSWASTPGKSSSTWALSPLLLPLRQHHNTRGLYLITHCTTAPTSTVLARGGLPLADERVGSGGSTAVTTTTTCCRC